jgi:nicotinamide-nucleotide amidase
MRAVILSIGSELLQGFLTDTNATFLAQELTGLGIELVGVSQVDDNLERVVRAFRRALDDADLVISTGGIGPTDDDLTREAIATVVGETPEVDPHLADVIRTFFARRGVPMPEQNVKQAWVIPSCKPLPNPMGTAPGWFVLYHNQVLVAMPGVPREMYRMWSEQAVPRILQRLGSHVIVSCTLKTIGIGESAVEQELIDLVRRGHPTVATYAKDDGVHVRISAHAEDSGVARRLVEETEHEVRRRLERYVYGDLSVQLASAILEPLAATGSRLAVWEAGSAGRLATLLGESPLADLVLEHCSSVTYRALAADGSAKPEQLASSGAREAAVTVGVDYGAAIVVAVSEGSSDDRATADIALGFWHAGEVRTRSHTVSANPTEIRRRAAMWAADFLWTAVRNTTASRMD